jgi:hypothetical protein
MKNRKKMKIKEKKGRNKGDSLVSDMKKENKNKRKKRTNCELCKVANILNAVWYDPGHCLFCLFFQIFNIDIYKTIFLAYLLEYVLLNLLFFSKSSLDFFSHCV